MTAHAMRKPVFHLCVALLLIVALAVVATGVHPADLGVALAIAGPSLAALVAGEHLAPAVSRLVFAALVPFRGPPAPEVSTPRTSWTNREDRWRSGTGWRRS